MLQCSTTLRGENMEDCQEWEGQRTPQGYGYTTFEGKHWRAHRLVWTLAHGEIPKGFYICHTCDNPPCVNIDHLWLGTPTDNARDREAKGRGVQPNHNKFKTHCKRGHPFDQANTVKTVGGRRCRKCRCAYQTARYRERKVKTR